MSLICMTKSQIVSRMKECNSTLYVQVYLSRLGLGVRDETVLGKFTFI
jgi:hypothetical protein